MNRLMLISAAGLVWVLSLPGVSPAQSPLGTRPGYYNPYLNQPRLSPYLNLARGSFNNPAINYYLGTLPEFERRAYQATSSYALRRLEQQQLGLAEEVSEDLQAEVLPTGHPAQFNNTYGYFPQTGPGGTRYGTGPAQRPQQSRRGTW
jgi:hypothetical protein